MDDDQCDISRIGDSCHYSENDGSLYSIGGYTYVPINKWKYFMTIDKEGYLIDQGRNIKRAKCNPEKTDK